MRCAYVGVGIPTEVGFDDCRRCWRCLVTVLWWMRWLLLLPVCGRTTRPVRAPGLCWTAVCVGLVMLALVVVVAVVVVVLSWWCGVVLFAFGCGGPAVGSLYVCE